MLDRIISVTTVVIRCIHNGIMFVQCFVHAVCTARTRMNYELILENGGEKKKKSLFSLNSYRLADSSVVFWKYAFLSVTTRKKNSRIFKIETKFLTSALTEILSLKRVYVVTRKSEFHHREIEPYRSRSISRWKTSREKLRAVNSGTITAVTRRGCKSTFLL